MKKLQVSIDKLEKACISSGIDNIDTIIEIMIIMDIKKGIPLKSFYYDENYTYIIDFDKYMIFYEWTTKKLFALKTSDI